MKLFSDETLSHYGIPGQKKGVRRWQYEDGRFNEEGKIRYFGEKKGINDVTGLTPEERNKYNQELYDYQLENRYKEMMNERNHPKMTKVKKTLTKIMTNTVVDSLIISALLWAGSKYMQKNNIQIKSDILNNIKDIADKSRNLREWVGVLNKK